MQYSPKLSIIIPTFNAESTIQQCIESINSQLFRDYEVLVIDGASADNTVAIVKSFVNSQILLSSEKDRGVYDAMNKGIDLAKGEWLYFLGSDDYLSNEHILESIFNNKDIHNYNLVYGNVIFTPSNELYSGETDWINITQKSVCHQAIFYRKNLFEKFGKYKLEYSINADWELNIRIFANETKIKYLNKVIAFFSTEGMSSKGHDASLFANLLRLIKEIKRTKSLAENIRYHLCTSSTKTKKIVKSILLRPLYFALTGHFNPKSIK